MIKKLYKLKVGDKFWLADTPYLVIDLNLSQVSLTTTYPEVICVLSLTTYKVFCFDKNTTVIQDKDNFPV